MAVTVVGCGSDPAVSSDVHLEEGQHVVVHDSGDLEVLDGLDGRQVAWFAAGTWRSAQVED